MTEKGEKIHRLAFLLHVFIVKCYTFVFFLIIIIYYLDLNEFMVE